MSRQLQVGFRRPDREVDRPVLLADGVGQLADHVSDGAVYVPKRQAGATSAFTAVDRERGRDLAFHLHFRVRWVAGDVQHYCAVVQHSPIYPDDTVRGDGLWQSHLRLREPQAPKVNKSMLVLVPEVVDGPEISTIKPPVPLWVGLQRLDKCLWAGADAPELVHPAAVSPVTAPRPSSLPLVEHGLGPIDREGAEGNLFAGPIDAERVDALVEGGSEVVDGLPKDDGPIDRHRLEQLQSVEVFASLIVYLWGHQSIWPGCIPRGPFIVGDSEVLVRSRDLSLYPREGVRGDFHDVILPAASTSPSPVPDSTHSSTARES